MKLFRWYIFSKKELDWRLSNLLLQTFDRQAVLQFLKELLEDNPLETSQIQAYFDRCVKRDVVADKKRKDTFYAPK